MSIYIYMYVCICDIPPSFNRYKYGHLHMYVPIYTYTYLWVSCHLTASQVALVVKIPPANAEGLERCWFDPWVSKIPLEEEMATHSSILAWRIPWTGKPGRLQSVGLQSQTRLKWLSMHRHHITKWKHQTSYLCILHQNLILTLTLQISFIWI